MGIELRTHKLLWGKSGNKCAMEDCRHDLIVDETETDDESIIGEEAHIVARKTDGPRGISTLTADERDQYSNLILLCRKHHKIIDDQPNTYTVEKLHEIKQKHERWVQSNLVVDNDKERDDLRYASNLDAILKKLDFDNWKSWTSSLVSHGQPSLKYQKLVELKSIPNYIISRFWPQRYEPLKNAIYNLKNVLNDLVNVFLKYSNIADLTVSDKQDIDKEVWTRKFYDIDEWNPKLYDQLSEKFEYHVNLVEDLTLELTRAGNLVIEMIRAYIAPYFREEEGKLLIESGPHLDFSFKTTKVEYNETQRKEKYPYGGLEHFMINRVNRDRYYGDGVDASYLPPKADT